MNRTLFMDGTLCAFDQKKNRLIGLGHIAKGMTGGSFLDAVAYLHSLGFIVAIVRPSDEGKKVLSKWGWQVRTLFKTLKKNDKGFLEAWFEPGVELYPKQGEVFLVGKHPYSYRKGEKALILGVKMVTPEEAEPRVCFEIKFEDGAVDLVPLSEVEKGNFEIMSGE